MANPREYEFVAYPKLNHVKVGFVDIVFRNLHIHREHELGLVLDGAARLTTNGQSFDVGRGSLYFFNANEAHDIAAHDQQGVRIAYIQISNGFCQDYLHLFRNLEVLRSDLTHAITPDQNRELVGLVLRVLRCYMDDGALSLLHSLSAICQLFSRLLDTVPYALFDEASYQSRKRKTARLQRITEYIGDHYTEKLTLAELAAQESVSPTHLSHFITENLNISFQDYLNNLRFEKAVQLISTSRLRLTDICLECGFSDIKYMNRMFQKRLGCLPKAYRAACAEAVRQEPSDTENQAFASEQVGRTWLERFVREFESAR